MSTRKSTAAAAVVAKVTTTGTTSASTTVTTTTTASTSAPVTVTVTAAAIKAENATTATATKAKTTSEIVEETTKSEMGTNVSTAAGKSSDKEISETANKEEPTKVETSKLGEIKRLTRNSPLPIIASEKTSDKKITDSEPTNSESEEGSISGGAAKKIRSRKTLKESAKDAKDLNIATEQKEKQSETVVTAAKDLKDNNKNEDTTKETKDSKDTKESKETKPSASKDTSATSSHTTTTSSSNSGTTTTNRLTRKSAAQDLAATTRITRNRQTSGTRSETPPSHSVSARGRRPAARKMPVPMVETTTKRKRSDEDGSSSAGNAEPGAKYIKIEVKDDADDAVSNDSVKIKQELIESDDAATTTTASTASRGRGRWGPRKPVVAGANLQNSPNTRATRQSKVNSPSPSPSVSSTGSDAKRRRTTTPAATGSTVLRSSSSNSLPKCSQLQHDEDSKDSMGSSMDELLCNIKLEKLTPELDDEEFEMAIEERGEQQSAQLAESEAEKKEPTPEKETTVKLVAAMTEKTTTEKVTLEKPASEKTTSEKTTSEKVTSEKTTSEKTTSDKPVAEKAATASIGTATEKVVPAKKKPKASNGVAEPLSVDTVASARHLEALPKEAEPCVLPAVAAASTSDSKLSSEKAASLSPELVSEGVCEISVKQFYKKPQFLENNLGIEEDPKLGEIVQKVSTEKAVAVVKEPEKMDEPVVDDKLFDELSLSPLKEGDLLLDESTDEKKSTNTIEDNISLSTENLSPLGLQVDEEEEDDEEHALVVDETQTQSQEELTEDGAEAEQEDDDAVTVEESETISMDNNASTEDVREREEMEAAELAEDKEDFYEKVEEKKQHENNDDDDDGKAAEKCDKKEQQQNEMMRETVKNIIAETESSATVAEKENIKVEHPSLKADLTTKLLNTLGADKHIKKDEKRETQKMEECAKEAASKFDLESEQVIAKIDAELEAIGAKEKQTKQQNKAKLKKEEEEEEQQQLKDEAEEVKQQEQIKEKLEETKALITKIEILAEKFNTAPELELETKMNVVVSEPSAPELNLNAEAEESLASTNTSPTKLANKEEDTHSTKSGQSTDTNSWVTLDLEYDEETLRQKEQHLQNLGLLTHKAAEQRRQEFIQSSAAAVEASQRQATTKRNGKAATSHEYTGTLKTVIKLNRSAGSAAGPSTSSNGAGGRKNTGVVKDAAGARRQSLKMTFQKGRGRGQPADRAADNQAHLEDSYYTIQNENEGAPKSTPVTEQTNFYTHGRKSYNRSNTTSTNTTTTNSATVDSSHSEGHDVANAASTSSKNTEKEEILIPEKASSFKFHPGRLCQDQCFYCSGKFGLYDTPCHVGQIKSTERQQKILENEEKLTVDNCLCDACFRHVDRRANVPSYKKRLSASGHPETSSSAVAAYTVTDTLTDSHQTASVAALEDAQARKCLVPDCTHPAAHSLRRKCIRKSVKKFLLNFDMPAGGSYVSLCQAHYDAVIQCSGCVLCKRRLGKNHMYHITSDTDRLEKALSEMGIPVQLGIGTAVCKLCRYFANLLMKPPDSSKSQKAEFVKNYRKRLLQFHNIHDGSNDASEADEEDLIATAGTSATTTPQKQIKQAALGSSAGNTSIETTPAKELCSPTGSTGSSVELIGEATATPIAATTDKANKNSSSSQLLLDHDVLVDYDVPMISSESNTSSPSPPAATAVATSNNNNNNNQMSKLKAILQSSTSATAAYDERNDISNVLRSNPNISMRELFPGEEDLGLNFKAPFGSSTSQRTPEGWTRVQTFLQYDEPTRRLWEELQKPYGNQSSFLRHLILLEKYFRNGDLVLTPHASSNASVYTQTVQQRLNSYDKGHCGGLDAVPKKATAATALQDKSTSAANDVIAVDGDDGETQAEALSKELRSRSVSVDKLAKQLNTNAVTITARPKDSKDAASASPQKSLLIGNSSSSSNSNNNSLKEKDMAAAITTITPNTPNLAAAAAAAAAALASSNSATTSSNSRSILKSNLLGLNNKSVEILPITAATHAVNKSSVSSAETKQQKILEVANKLLGNQLEAAAASTASNSAASSANNNKTGAVVSLLTSPPELVSLQRRSSSSGSAGPSTAVVSAPVAAPPVAPAAAPTTSNSTTASLINAKRPHLMPKAATNNNRSAPPNVVILPDTLTPQERLQSKSWRPTLMPVEENQHLVNKAGPLYQTADGRRLPALVQVQSGGKPFLISIFDYNRMCILRREKLLRDQMLKATKNRREQQQQQQQQQRNAASAAAAAAAAQANLHNAYNSVANKQQQAAQQQLIHLQLMQMQKQQQKQQQQAALKSIARFQPIAPKPPIASSANNATTTSTSAASTSAGSGNQNMQQQNFSAPMMPLLANAITNAANAAAVANANNAAAAAANASWLWNNFPDANQMLMNGAGATAGGKQLPHLLPKPASASYNTGATAKQQHHQHQQHPQLQQHQQQQQQQHHQHQLMLDNTLMSKIPKSLTVIPQHKLMMTGNNVGLGNSGNKE